MCRSVPQMAVFSTRIRTSFGPGCGTGTSSIHMPLAASRLTSAFMVEGVCGDWLAVDDMDGPGRRTKMCDCTVRPPAGPRRDGRHLPPPRPHAYGHGVCLPPSGIQGVPVSLRPLPAALAIALLSTTAHADEGMWMPSQLPQIAAQLEAAGFKGDPKDLADLTKPPMSAVVSLGGCTASF